MIDNPSVEGLGFQNKDERIEDYSALNSELCQKIMDEAKADNTDPQIMFFKLKSCIYHDMDLINLLYEPEIIPLLHKNLEKLVSGEVFTVINAEFKEFKFDNTNDMLKLLTWYWENFLQGVFDIDDLQEQIARKFVVEYNYRISGMPLKRADVEYELHNRGIKKITTSYPEDPDLQPIVREMEIWTWRDFRLLQILRDQGETETIYKYNFVFNGDIYQDKTLLEMREMIYEGFCKSAGKDKQIFGLLVDKYVQEGKIPIMEYSNICGFTKAGWKMPDRYYIKFTPIQAKIKNCIYQTCKMKFTIAEAKEMMKQLYNATSLRYKDVLFAHMAIMPFLYALRDYTDLLYWVALGSPAGNTGKTPAGVMITNKIWNNLPRPFITKDQASTESRLGDFISSSTFGILIDDCGDLPEEIGNTIKSYITGEAGFTRKNTDQTARIDKDFSNPLVMTMNRNIPLFDDYAFLSRGIYIPVNEVPTPDQVKAFKEVWKNIPKGYIGRYIYEKTKDLDVEYFHNAFDFTDDWKSSPLPRSNVIYKLLQLGKYLFDQLFEISLNISDAIPLITNTLTMGSDDIFTIVMAQIEDARVDDGVIQYDATIDDPDAPNGLFKPKRKWITAPLYHKNTKKFAGFLYTADNLQDMLGRLRLKTGIDLPSLTEILKKRWPHVEYTTSRISGGTYKGIYIPDEDLNENKPDDNSFKAKQETIEY